jgi:hypothetical protein
MLVENRDGKVLVTKAGIFWKHGAEKKGLMLGWKIPKPKVRKPQSTAQKFVASYPLSSHPV